MHDPLVDHYKIGWANDPNNRLMRLRCGNPRLILVHVDPEDYWTLELETKVHNVLEAQCVAREWFDCTLDEARAAIDQVKRGLEFTRFHVSLAPVNNPDCEPIVTTSIFGIRNSIQFAGQSAVEKMQEKWLRFHDKQTEWAILEVREG
jgi:hypothetical protein